MDKYINEQKANEIMEGYNHYIKKKKFGDDVIKMEKALKSKEMSNERFVSCCRKYCVMYGNLRVPDRYKMTIQYSDGTSAEYGLGNVMRKIRAAYEGRSLSRTLSDYDELRLTAIDEDWKMSDMEFEKELFMRCCRDFFVQNGHLRVEEDYVMDVKLCNGQNTEYLLGKMMSGVKARLKGRKYGIILTPAMLKELNVMDKDWAVSDMQFDKEFKNQLLIDCAREFYNEYGHLRVSKDIEMEIVCDNGEVFVYPFGKDLYTCRSYINRKTGGRRLPDEVLKELDNIDARWKLTETEYSRVKFMECARIYFEENGHLRPTIGDKVEVIHNGEVVENYCLGVILRKCRYDLINNGKSNYVTGTDVKILNKMDPYWIGREKEVNEMRLGTMDEGAVEEIDNYYADLVPTI